MYCSLNIFILTKQPLFVAISQQALRMTEFLTQCDWIFLGIRISFGVGVISFLRKPFDSLIRYLFFFSEVPWLFFTKMLWAKGGRSIR